MLSVTLMFAICWLLNIYGGYLECIIAGGPLSTRMPMFHSVLSIYCSTTFQTLLLGSTHSFLRLTNVFFIKIQIRKSFVFTVPSFCILLWSSKLSACDVYYIYTVYTVKPRKTLVSLWFHCQWNNWGCMASIPTHCPFKASQTWQNK